MSRYYYGVQLQKARTIRETLLMFVAFTKLEYIQCLKKVDWIVFSSTKELNQEELEERLTTKIKALYG